MRKIQSFDHLVSIVNSKHFPDIKTGLLLLEQVLDDSNSLWEKMQEIEVFNGQGEDKDFPMWLRDAPFRGYVGLWMKGIRAKRGEQRVLQTTWLRFNEPNFPSFPSTLVHLRNLEELELLRSPWTEVNDFWDQFPRLHRLSFFDNELQTLPPSIGRCSTLSNLNIAGNPFTTLPESIRTLHNLRHLSLRYSQIEEIPDWIGGLSNLETLDLQDSAVTALPASICALHSLKTLNCERSNLRTIPKEIGLCRSLERFEINDTNVDTLPDSLHVLHCRYSFFQAHLDNIRRLSNLQILDCSNYKGGIANFGIWPNLRSLTLQWAEQIDFFSLGTCSNLEELSIEAYQLDDPAACQLPEELSRCTKLRILNVANSNIEKLPEGSSNWSNLQELKIHRSKITTLPAGLTNRLCQYTGVQPPDYVDWVLDIDCSTEDPAANHINRIRFNHLLQQVCYDPDLRTLQQLVVPPQQPLNNNIALFDNLQRLTFRGPSVLELPSAITKLPNLIEIDLREVQMVSFQEDVFRGLLYNPTIVDGHLRFSVNIQPPAEYALHLLNLRITVAEEHQLLDQIEYLYEDFSDLTSIPDTISKLSNLKILSLKGCPITALPESLRRCQQLEQVILDVRKLETIPSWFPDRSYTWETIETFWAQEPSFSNLQKLSLRLTLLENVPEQIYRHVELQYLDLSWNQLTELPKEMSQLINLRTLRLEANPLADIPHVALRLPKLRRISLPLAFRKYRDAIRQLYPHIQLFFPSA